MDLTEIVVLDEESNLTGVAGTFSFAAAFASLLAVDLPPFTTTSASFTSSAAEEAREERDSFAGVDFTLGALTGVGVALLVNQSAISVGKPEQHRNKATKTCFCEHFVGLTQGP